jgi:hypothetical protein
MDGWMDGRESRVKYCLQQSKKVKITYLLRFLIATFQAKKSGLSPPLLCFSSSEESFGTKSSSSKVALSS